MDTICSVGGENKEGSAYCSTPAVLDPAGSRKTGLPGPIAAVLGVVFLLLRRATLYYAGLPCSGSVCDAHLTQTKFGSSHTVGMRMGLLCVWTSRPLFAARPWRTEGWQQGVRGYAFSSRADANIETFEVRCGSAGSVTVEYVFSTLIGFLLYVCLYSWLSIWGCKGGGLVFCGHVISDYYPGLTLLYRPYSPYLVRYEDLHDVPWSVISFFLEPFYRLGITTSPKRDWRADQTMFLLTRLLQHAGSDSSAHYS